MQNYSTSPVTWFLCRSSCATLDYNDEFIKYLNIVETLNMSSCYSIINCILLTLAINLNCICCWKKFTCSPFLSFAYFSFPFLCLSFPWWQLKIFSPTWINGIPSNAMPAPLSMFFLHSQNIFCQFCHSSGLGKIWKNLLFSNIYSYTCHDFLHWNNIKYIIYIYIYIYITNLW